MNRKQRRAQMRLQPEAPSPTFAQAVNEGLAFHAAGQIDQAIEAFRRATVLNPKHPLSFNNLGGIMQMLGKPEEAAAYCRQALAIDPNFAMAHNNLALALADLRRHDEAIVSLQRAIALNPNNPGAMTNMTNSFLELGRLEEAVDASRRAIALLPNDPKAYSNMGTALAALGRFDEAIAAFRIAVTLPGSPAMAHKNLGISLMHRGQFAEGWREYDWRWGADRIEPPRYPQPMWQGEPLAGRTLVLFTEQGLGDVMHFARFVPVIAATGGRVVLQVHHVLMRLMRTLPGVAEVCGLGENTMPPPFDCYHALMSVPGLIGLTPETIPAPVPYLAAEPELRSKWRTRLGTHGFKIGICWQGKAKSAGDAARSVPLSQFAPLARIPGVRLISLQKQAVPDPLAATLPVETLSDFDDGPDAFIDTAAIIENLYLVITIDTSIAHLAGALARPVWVALKYVPDWRWTMYGTTTPWYPTARLFRQPRIGAWDEPFRQIAEALAIEVGKRAPLSA